MYDQDAIAAYLHFGFVPGCGTATGTDDFLAKLLGGVPRRERRRSSGSVPLRAEGVEALRSALRRSVYETDAHKTHVLPLSGGLDSRAILGGMLENLAGSRIQAVTFGTPGTWDYEIGRQVARSVGVRWEPLDLTGHDWRWNTNDLVQTASRTGWPVWIFDAHINRQIPELFGPECVYWSGFMGEALSGAHLPEQESATWEQAIARFVKKNRLGRSSTLAPPEFQPGLVLPGAPFMDSGALSFDDQLDFGVRQQCRIKHVVMAKGYEYRTPFLDTGWSGFILSVPRRHRNKQALYQQILQAAYKGLMSLPVKGNAGLPLGAPQWRKLLPAGRLHMHASANKFLPWLEWGVSPKTNYIDFDRGLRQRADLKEVVRENLHDLKKRGIVQWLDIDELWKRHQRRIENCAMPLLLLASLEIQIKAGGFGRLNTNLAG